MGLVLESAVNFTAKSWKVKKTRVTAARLWGAVAESSTFLPHVKPDAVLGAEVLWTLKTCISHNSYDPCSDIGAVFRKKFPDSK